MTQELLLQLSTAILLLPLLSFLLLIFFGKRLPRQGDTIATSILGVTLLTSLVILIAKLSLFHDELLNYTFTWVDFKNVAGIGPLKLDLGIMIDNVTAIMLVVVTLISFVVHLFSTAYMSGDVRYSRYFAYLGFFSFSMLGIVITNNFFLMYVFWELVGISSYLLIGHWYEKKSAADAGKKAFIVNRIGDVGMFIGINILWANFHTFTFDGIFSAMASGHIPFDSNPWLTAAGILIFCGAIGKSAQFPLHVWLPDAMEGPTPVSALIHAATMVAAGVYLVARVFPMMTADALVFIAYIGALKAFHRVPVGRPRLEPGGAADRCLTPREPPAKLGLPCAPGARGAADEVRAGDQPHDGEGARVDHSAIVAVAGGADPQGRNARWLLKLSSVPCKTTSPS